MKSILELGQASRRQFDILSIQSLLSMENGVNFEDWNRYTLGRTQGMAIFMGPASCARLDRGTIPGIVADSPSKAFVAELPSRRHCGLLIHFKCGNSSHSGFRSINVARDGSNGGLVLSRRAPVACRHPS